MQTLPRADIDPDHNLLVAKICIRLKKTLRFHQRRTQLHLQKLYIQRQRVQDTLEEKIGAIGCDRGNVEMQWKNIKEYVVDTVSVLDGKVERRARKPWISQEMISKMNERRKWENVNTEEGRKNYRRLRKELKRATDSAEKEYL